MSPTTVFSPWTPGSAGDDQPGRDADAGLQRPTIRTCQAPDSGDEFQPGTDRAFGRVFLRSRKAEIRQDAVAQVLCDMAVVSADDRGADLAVLVQQAAHVLGVELTGEPGRADQIAEDHGDLAALDARCLWAWGIHLRRTIRRSCATRAGVLPQQQ